MQAGGLALTPALESKIILNKNWRRSSRREPIAPVQAIAAAAGAEQALPTSQQKSEARTLFSVTAGSTTVLSGSARGGKMRIGAHPNRRGLDPPGTARSNGIPEKSMRGPVTSSAVERNWCPTPMSCAA